jgi:hypothetical protein
MAEHDQSRFRHHSISEGITISNHESESESEQNLLQCSAKKNSDHAQHDHRRLELPATETPIRSRLAAVPLTLSASSSSTISSIFSSSSNGPGTPLTPPLLETHTLDNSKNSRVKNHDKTSRLLFVEKGSKGVGQSSITSHSLESATLARSPKCLSKPDVPMDGVEYTTVADQDELATCLGALSLNPSPVARQLQRRKMLDQVVETVENILDGEHEAQIPNDKSGLFTAVASQDERIVSKKGGVVPVLPLVASSKPQHPVDHDRPTVNHNERNKILTKPIIQSEVDGNIGGGFKVCVEGLSTSDGADESKPRHPQAKERHKRSKSLNIQDTALPTRPKVGGSDAGSKGPQVDERSSSLSVPVWKSITKGGRRASSGVSNLCSTPCKTRSRSTGSVPEARKSHPPIRTSGRLSDGRDSASSKPESMHASGTEIGPKPSAVPTSVAVHTKRIPKFQRYKEEESENAVKIGVLSALRRANKEKQPKSRRLSPKIRDIWKEIRGWIWNNIKKLIQPCDGFIYVFKCASFPPGYVKIGKTSQDWPVERMKQWEGKCQITGIRIPDPNDKRFRHYGIVERIVHAELRNERRTYICWCGVRHQLMIDQENTTRLGHQEWFEIGEQKALEVVEKWRRWVVQMQPYKKDGSLRACWIWKHDQAMIAKEIDWVVWQEFGWLETFQCCCYCLDKWVANLWPAGGKVLLSPELFALGLAVGFPLYISGFSMQSCVIFLAILVMYVFLWFNYS